MLRSGAKAVLYHYPCPDGAFAALAAHLYFSSLPATTAAATPPPLFFPNTVYAPLRPGDLPISQIDCVYLLDFVGPPCFLRHLSSLVRRVIVLDHHKTALEMLGAETYAGGEVFKVIDMDRSGATIAYDYFLEKLLTATTRDSHNGAANDGSLDRGIREFRRLRRLFEYIEDRDLWRWKLPDSKAFSNGLDDLKIEFNARSNPSLFDQSCSLDLDSLISQGKMTISRKQKLIDDSLERSFIIALGGGTFGHCLAVNADALFELRSELGNQLAIKSRELKLRGIGAVIYKVHDLKNDEVVKISLRSVDSEDTTPISQKYGGGGHRNASSFMLNYADFEKWKVLDST
ncbi:unnamed protein product [Cuscuta campestris]|uniref:DHHA1 domain-containing protein n=1 Tax=Cuscuta campestris TaxID=132261 RepID=A0A484LEX3_9ASTE|nr:unnamed protein product [Cuscuta campestris]